MSDFSLEQKKALALASARMRMNATQQGDNGGPVSAQPESPNPENQGFIGNLGQDFKNRVGMAEDIKIAQKYGQQTLGESLWQGVGKVGFGALNDIGAEMVKSGFESLPNKMQSDIKGAGSYIANTAMGRAGLQAAKQGAEAYSKWAKENPRFARNLEAGVDIASIITPVKGTSAASLTGEAVGGITSAVKKMAPAEIKTAAAARDIATGVYESAKKQGGSLNKEFSNSFLKDIGSLGSQSEWGRAIAGETPVSKLIERANTMADKPMDLLSAMDVDQELGGLIHDAVKPDGHLTDIGRRYQQIQIKLRESIKNATPEQFEGGRAGFDASIDARKVWSQAAKMADIERIIQRADVMQNSASAIQTGFRNLWLNKSRLSAYTPQERALIYKASKDGIAVDLLRTVGSRLGTIGMMVGGAGGGPIGSASGFLAGRAARYGAEVLQQRPVNKLLRGLSEDVSKYGKKYEGKPP
jgi:hypothetical protein